MKQKEVTDEENTRWTCVQAYSGLEGKISGKTEELSENDEGKVPVVCTPSGGAQSVRIELQKNWEENVPEEELLAKIKAARD